MTTVPAYKVCILGNYGSGKSTLFNLLSEPNTTATNTSFTNINTSSGYVQLWNVTNSDINSNNNTNNSCMPDSYYQNAAAYIIMFDTHDRASFHGVSRWWNDIKEHHGNNNANNMSSIAVLVIGSRKSSISTKKRPVICTSYGEEWADTHSCSYGEIDLDLHLKPDILERISFALSNYNASTNNTNNNIAQQVQIQIPKVGLLNRYMQYIYRGCMWITHMRLNRGNVNRSAI